MKKLAAIIDFNNIAMRAMFTCQYMGEDSVTNFETRDECRVFIRKVATDLSTILRTFEPDRVIVACDSKDPWRKSVEVDDESGKYKGNRERDNNRNWENIFKSLDEFREVLRSRGFVVTEIPHAEADDIASMWSAVLKKDGFDVVMVSSDRDWSQLVRFDKDSNGSVSFCISYNPVSVKQCRKVYVPQGFTEWYDTDAANDIFFSGYDEMRTRLRNAMKSNPKISFETIDADRVLMDKIMCGDDGDNVPSFFDYYKNGKKVRVTPLKSQHVYESLGIRTFADLERCVIDGTMKPALEKEMKTEIDVDFQGRLTRQRKLVRLDESEFPETIVRKFKKHEEESKSVGYVQSHQMKMEDILGGTDFMVKKFKPVKMNSIFDDVASLGKFSKIPRCPNKIQ